METITISVARFYGNPSYYGTMPRAMFAALELAFVSGCPSAVVSLADLQTTLAHAQS